MQQLILRNTSFQSDFDDVVDVPPGVPRLPIENWLIRGVLREDDVLPSDYKHSACGQPELDPYGPIRRVLNHFNDPVNDRELRPFGARCSDIPVLNISCTKSIDWAFGLTDSFANNPQVNMSRRNHFSYVDARENMWLALTGERGRAMAPYTAAERADEAQERLYRWATAFRSLGNVIHLLEDGAQPQHVRNDAHSPVLTSSEQQAYESYVNAQTQSQAVTDIRDLPGEYVRDFFNNPTDKTKLPTLNTGSYPAVMFATPLRFFTTRAAGDTSTTLPNNRYGLLDYTNRSFFSGGTRPKPEQANGNGFLSPPSLLDAAHGYASVKKPCELAKNLDFRIRAVTCSHDVHAVPDSVTPGYVDVLPEGFTTPPLLAEGVLKISAEAHGAPSSSPFKAIGLEEMQTMSNLAIPRAIGYSAGLINYFFRGQLSITPPPVGLYAVLDHGKPQNV